MNPFKTKNFLFLDAGHMCATEIKPGEIPTYEEHFDKVQCSNLQLSLASFHLAFSDSYGYFRFSFL